MPLRLKIEPKIKVIFFSLSRAEEWRREIEEKRRCIADNELDFISVFFLCFIQGYPTKIDFGLGLFIKVQDLHMDTLSLYLLKYFCIEYAY